MLLTRGTHARHDDHRGIDRRRNGWRHPGTSLAGIFAGVSTGFADDEVELLAQMSATADRPLNWNLLVVDATAPDRIAAQMAPSRRAREIGGRVVALTMLCGSQDENIGMFRRLTGFAGYRIGDTYGAANAGLSGRVVADVAAERGADSFDTLIDIALADDLRTVLWLSATDDDDAHWTLRAELWNDADVLLGGSDAGAHLDRMCGGTYPTQFIGDCLRGRQLMSMERAVHLLTDVPARLFGLRDRGRIEIGAMADIVLFDPATVNAAPARLVNDLPGGSARLTADAVGVHRVMVNGVATVLDGASTGKLPGTMLRSGRDTCTVSTRASPTT